MRTFLIILIAVMAVLTIFIFYTPLPAIAQDMKTLQEQAQNTNYQVIKLRGQIELNTIMLQDAGRRSAKYADQMVILQEDLERINKAAAKLRAETEQPVEDK